MILQIFCRWIGTAPFCAGDPTDCTGTTPYYYTVWSKCGDGDQCWTGYKAICCNQENIYTLLYWKGTAPFCGGKCSDCNDDICVTTSDCGDGAECWSGKKVLCGRLPTVTMAEVEELQKISAYTREREEGYKKAQVMGGGVRLKEPMEPYPDLVLAYVNYDRVIEDN